MDSGECRGEGILLATWADESRTELHYEVGASDMVGDPHWTAALQDPAAARTDN